MADSHSLQKSPGTQVIRLHSHRPSNGQGLAVIDAEPVPAKLSTETVLSLGVVQPVEELLDYIAQCSPEGLSRLNLKYAEDVAAVRGEIRTLLDRLADAVALQKFVRWQAAVRPRPPAKSIAERRAIPVPENITLLDPFFRRSWEAPAIVRTQNCWNRSKWRVYYRRFGCLVCGQTREPQLYLGCCKACHQVLGRRLHVVDSQLLPDLRESIPQGERWARYFDRHGCSRCAGRDNHGACGFCAVCYDEICERLRKIESDLRSGAAQG